MSPCPSGETIKTTAETASRPSIVMAIALAASVLPKRAANAIKPQEKAVTKNTLCNSHPTTRVYTPSAAATAVSPTHRSKTSPLLGGSS